MANVTAGMQGESVAQIQRWLAAMAKMWKLPVPTGFLINGTYDAKTVALMKLVQKKGKVPQTGNYNDMTRKMADNVGKFLKSTRFGWLPKTRGIADDRTYVVQQFQYLFGRPPTETELTYRVSQLQGGMARASWTAGMEKYDTVESVKRIFEKMFGRDPTPAESTQWSSQLKAGATTREAMTNYLKSTHEYLTKKKEDELKEGTEDQKVALEDLLDEYGLGTLKDWAWEQIKSGVSETRIIQNLRETTEYKARFPGMAARGTAGLPAINEAEYLNYEREAREIFRRHGLPPGFYDDPNDFAALVAADISPDELGSRVREGYARVVEAPIEVRQAFAEMYGIDGDAALATLYIDPDRGEAALLKQARAAEAMGWGGLFGIDFSQGESETLAGINLETDALRQGLGDISSMEQLFTESVSEEEDYRAGEQGIEAVFNTGGEGANELDQRRRQRIATLAGGGGANISAEGLGLGAAD